MSIVDICHPEYNQWSARWDEWRTVFEGGQCFIDRYLKRFSCREQDDDFQARKAVTPCPAFAKSGVIDIKNSIYQRAADVRRLGGDQTYQRAMAGLDGGVDLCGSSMNYFIGRDVLTELMTMSKVGLYLDMPRLSDKLTVAEAQGKHPYLYMYTAEQIKSWSYCREGDPTEFEALLLEETCYEHCPETGLPLGECLRYRHVWRDENGQVWLQYYDKEGKPIGEYDNDPSPIKLGIDCIPFHVMRLNGSLLEDISRHQIALLNLESSDVIYALLSNIPIYVEQADPNDTSDLLLGPASAGADGSAAGAISGRKREVAIGHMQGRTYGIGTQTPEFINPSSDPLRVSMEKQTQLKNDIRSLINLALSNTKQHVASAESKQLDERGLEAGLSNIGLELEQGERKIAEFWAKYMKSEAATVHYPTKYTLRSDDDRRKDAEAWSKLIYTIPSLTAGHEIQKQIVDLMLGPKLQPETLEKINKEIDTAEYLTSDPKDIQGDVLGGYLSLNLAAKIRGYPEAQVQEAKDEAIEKATQIAEAQAKANPAPVAGPDQARGAGAAGTDPQAGKKEKKTAKAEGKPTRGEGK